MTEQKRALITGVGGQDGSYLTEYLLEKGYEIHGIIRRQSTAENQDTRINHLHNKINTYYGDLLDMPSLIRIFQEAKPDEIYNLGAMSHVRISYDIPSFTIQTNALGVLNMLECYRLFFPKSKFYQASSSEMFGNCVDEDGKQKETTLMSPVSPYGCSKVLGFNLVRHYRAAYKLHACNGILFNHESVPETYTLLFKEGNSEEIDIKPIGEIVRHHTNKNKISIDNTKAEYQETEVSNDLFVWDKNGWTKVKFTSGFPHSICKENKNPKIIISKKSAVMATDTHKCIMSDNSEKDFKDIKIGDNLSLVSSFPAPVNSQKYIDSETAGLIGFIVGDGSCEKNRLRLIAKNKDDLKKYENYWVSLGKKVSYRQTKSSFKPFNMIWQLNLLEGKDWIDRFIPDLHTEDGFKRVPKNILNASEKTQLAFLNGYNDADGLKSNKCVYKFKNFTTNSATLAAGLIYLIEKTTKQKVNINVEKVFKFGKQNLYYRINLLSNSRFSKSKSFEKIETIKKMMVEGLSQREISRQTNISRKFISNALKNKEIFNIDCKEISNNSVKKIIEMNDYDGWFYDLETESGTFHCGIGYGHVHNSPRRGSNFVTNKVVKTAVQIKKGYKDKLILGNLDSYRDWGHSKDYVRAMHMILNHSIADDFVVATGETHSIRQLCEYVFSYLKMDYRDYVHQDPKFMRPEELKYLCGDSTKTRTILKWKPIYTFETLLEEMVDYWMSQIK